MSKLGVIRGRVWKFGNNISTTDITPTEMFIGRQLRLKDVVFAAIRSDWKNKVKPGDCIVAGDNFGFGSHRTSASNVMRDLGIGCIVANSIARSYYRTMISMGFPTFPCPGVSEIFEEGNEIELDIYKGLVRNISTGHSIQSKPYPPRILEILEAGGLMLLLLDRISKMK